MRESRSSGRRRLTLRLAALLLPLAAALAALLGSVGVGQAQTAVSLIEVMGGGISIGFEGERVLGIETAASAGAAYDGWLVTEVELRIRPDDPTGVIRTATPPGLAICESDDDGDPDGTCYPLIAPGTVQVPAGMSAQEVTYTAPGSGYFLTAGVNYTLHFTENNSTHPNNVHILEASNSDGEVTSVAGTFRHAMRILQGDGTWALSATNIAWARITGYASITPPGGQVLISNIEQSGEPGVRFGGASGKDGAQGFTTGTDPGGYTLTGIQLRLGTDTTTGTTTPTVKLLLGSPTGAEVAAFSGPASLAAGPRTREYTFTPSAAVTLSASTRYFLVAEGGGSRWPSAASLTPDGAPGHGWAFDGVFKERAQLAAGALEGHEAELVDDQQRDPQVTLMEPREGELVARLDQLAHEVGRADEGDPPAYAGIPRRAVAAARGLDAERDREVRLAGADRPGDHDDVGALDVLAGRELGELRPLDAPQRLPVELLEGLEVREPRLAQQARYRAVAAGQHLDLEQLQQELLVVPDRHEGRSPPHSGYSSPPGARPRWAR